LFHNTMSSLEKPRRNGADQGGVETAGDSPSI
jgi:hypothetical protein